MSHRDQPLIFIVGVGRSGTSLLHSMLNAHPAICLPPETGFVRRYLAGGAMRTLFDRGGDDLVIRHLKQDPLVGRLGLSGDALARAVHSAEPSGDPAAVFHSLLAEYAGDNGSFTWLGDKDPRSVEFLPLIRRHFPQARILHMIRDPRDILASKKKADWSKDRPPAVHVFANRVQLRMGRQLGPALFGPAYMEIVYERLISEPEVVLTEICKLLEIPFHRSMLEFADSSRQLVARDELAWKKETLGPLLSGNHGKWAESLSVWETALTERVCTPAFQAGGYETSRCDERLGLGQRATLLATSACLKTMDPIYRWYRAWKQD